MAVEDMLQLGGTADTAMTTLYGMMKWVLALAVVALIFWWLYNRKQYKYDVKLKVFQNEQFIYHEDKARIKKVDGVEFWYLKNLKKLVGVPPSSCTIYSTKGRWVGEGYFDREAGLLWSKDELSRQEFNKVIEKMKKDGTLSGSGVVDTHYQPMTATERSLMAHQITKALTRKGKDIWAMIMPLAFGAMMLVLIALILIFWNDIAKPVMSLSQQNVEISKDNKIMQQQNIRLYQMLTGGKGNGTAYIVQAIPADQQYFIPEFPGGNST